MANELIAVLESGIATQATFSQFTNDKLNRLTMRIHELTQATKRNLFEIAVSLSAIDAEKLHETAGYKSIHEYAEKNFGYKKSMVYKLLDVARKYIEPTEIDGHIVYVSKLAHADTDYSVSQLMEINRVEFDVAKSLDSVGAIMPSMTTKEIREIVVDYNNGEIDANGQPKKPVENDGDNATENDDVTENATANDCDICGEFDAIIEHCNKLLNSGEIDAKTAKKLTAFSEFAMKFVVDYRAKTAENSASN